MQNILLKIFRGNAEWDNLIGRVFSPRNQSGMDSGHSPCWFFDFLRVLLVTSHPAVSSNKTSCCCCCCGHFAGEKCIAAKRERLRMQKTVARRSFAPIVVSYVRMMEDPHCTLARAPNFQRLVRRKLTSSYLNEFSWLFQSKFLNLRVQKNPPGGISALHWIPPPLFRCLVCLSSTLRSASVSPLSVCATAHRRREGEPISPLVGNS